MSETSGRQAAGSGEGCECAPTVSPLVLPGCTKQLLHQLLNTYTGSGIDRR